MPKHAKTIQKQVILRWISSDFFSLFRCLWVRSQWLGSQVLPRKSTLIRRRDTSSHRKRYSYDSYDSYGGPMIQWVVQRRRHGTAAKPQVLCANLDLAILVLSIEPNFSEAIFMDRCLMTLKATVFSISS